MNLSEQQIERYSRHIILEEVGGHTRILAGTGRCKRILVRYLDRGQVLLRGGAGLADVKSADARNVHPGCMFREKDGAVSEHAHAG